MFYLSNLCMYFLTFWEVQKNLHFRAFFIALFRHINYVGARACHRTALEFCKLALSLDPDNDPLGILLTLDFYAIRAQQREYHHYFDFSNCHIFNFLKFFVF